MKLVKILSDSVQITPISAVEFKEMLGSGIRGFRIGEYAAYGCDAVVDGNKFFQRHACIVGNTGCGKSETVAKILEETAKLPGANLVVFDIHGEYSQLAYASNIRIGEDFPFPIWMFGFQDIVTNILKIREESATTVMKALRRAYYRVCPGGKENKPVYFGYHALVAEMERMDNKVVHTGEYYKTGDKAGTAKTTKGEYAGKLASTVNLLKDRMMDSRYGFLFAERLQSYLYEVMEAVLGTEKPVKNIDLSGGKLAAALRSWLIDTYNELPLWFDVSRLKAIGITPAVLYGGGDCKRLERRYGTGRD